jgi:hypothetical protein
MSLLFAVFIAIGLAHAAELVVLTALPQRISARFATVAYLLHGIYIIITPFGLLLSILELLLATLGINWLGFGTHLFRALLTIISLSLPLLIARVWLSTRTPSAQTST